MGLGVGLDPAASHDHDDWQVVSRHVMAELVKGPLQEGGVFKKDWPAAGLGKARREGHGILLGDPDVQVVVRVRLFKRVKAKDARDSGSDRHDVFLAAINGAGHGLNGNFRWSRARGNALW